MTTTTTTHPTTWRPCAHWATADKDRDPSDPPHGGLMVEIIDGVCHRGSGAACPYASECPYGFLAALREAERRLTALEAAARRCTCGALRTTAERYGDCQGV